MRIFADARQVNVVSDADLGEYFRITDAQKLEDLRICYIHHRSND